MSTHADDNDNLECDTFLSRVTEEEFAENTTQNWQPKSANTPNKLPALLPTPDKLPFLSVLL